MTGENIHYPRLEFFHFVEFPKGCLDKSICETGVTRPAAMGHKRSFTAMLPECPLPGAKRSFRHNFSGGRSRMSGFTRSGHSDSASGGILKGRFRPEAAVSVWPYCMANNPNASFEPHFSECVSQFTLFGIVPITTPKPIRTQS